MAQESSGQAMYDAVVIGAGAGGLCAAARLVAAGKKVLLVESKDRVGGRASSEIIEGFTVNIGAIAIELGGVFEETFNLVGVPLDLREPSPATVFRIDQKVINVSKGGAGVCCSVPSLNKRPRSEPSLRTHGLETYPRPNSRPVNG